MAFITKHAIAQCTARGVATPQEVLSRVNQVESTFRQVRVNEVRVVVKRIEYTYLPDGSNGDCVLACVTPDGIIKTVMLQRSSQVEHKSRTDTSALYITG